MNIRIGAFISGVLVALAGGLIAFAMVGLFALGGEGIKAGDAPLMFILAGAIAVVFIGIRMIGKSISLRSKNDPPENDPR